MSKKLLEKIEFLKTVELFANVNESALAHIADDFREQKYRAGDTIFNQGDESADFSVIKEGVVRIYHLSLGGEETTVNIFGPRELLGEFGVIDEKGRSASAVAQTSCTLLKMSRRRAIEHLTNIPGLALTMCSQIIQKTRWTTMYAETLARVDSPGQLLHLLLLYNEKLGKEIEPGISSEIAFGLNQKELSSMIGVNRQWIGGLMDGWKKRDMIDYSRKKITILDLPRVEAERDAHLER